VRLWWSSLAHSLFISQNKRLQ